MIVSDLWTVHIATAATSSELAGMFVVRGWMRDQGILVPCPDADPWAAATALLDVRDSLPNDARCVVATNPRDPTLIEVWI